MLNDSVVIPVDREQGEIPIVVLQYKDSFEARALEVKGVVRQGYNREDAIKKIKEALALHVASFGKNVFPQMPERATNVFLAKIKL